MANDGSNNVSAYTIDTTTGALAPSPARPLLAGTNPLSVTVDPSGKFAYVANLNSDNVSGYTINATTGAQRRRRLAVPRGNQSSSVTVDPSGKFAYVANTGTNNVSAYTINASTGALSAVAGSPCLAGTNPQSVTVDPSGEVRLRGE